MLTSVRRTCVILVFLLITTYCEAWPEGLYGLPMPSTGCPHSDDVSFQTGSRTQSTEVGSKASESCHLAGAPHGENIRKVTQMFCMKTEPHGNKKHEWTKGKYCILKKGDCPKDFNSGWIYWDDAAPFFGTTIQHESGSVPDGEYDRNTKVYYCCRSDGSQSNKLTLPTDRPFYLFKYGARCQEVSGMTPTEEWVYWATEKQLNMNAHGGTYPAMKQSILHERYTKLFYCYYTQKPENPRLHTVMVIIYVISGLVAAAILVFLVLFLVQRLMCCHGKRDYLDDNNVEGNAQDHMLDGAQSGPSVIYKPSANKHPLPPDNPPHEAAAFMSPSDAPLDEQKGALRDSKPPSYDEVLKEDGKL